MVAHSALSHSMVIVVAVWRVKAGVTGDTGDSRSDSFKTPFLPTGITGTWSQTPLYLGDCPVHWTI